MTPISNLDLEQMQRRLHLSTDDAPIRRTSSDAIAEAKLHAEIIAVFTARNWPYVHSRMDMKSSTGRGSPDFVVVTHRGIRLIECKSSDGKISPAQRIFIAMAKKLGTTVHVVRSMADFWEAVE